MPNQIIYEKELRHGKFTVFSHCPTIHFLSVKQIHSSIVVSESVLSSNLEIEADGIVGFSSIPKCILTADCLPIVIEGELGHAIVHAGWKGVKNKIAIDQKIKDLRPTLAFIGPHIEADVYEVQPDFKENFPYSKAFNFHDDKCFFDLSTEIILQLKNQFPQIEIVESHECTFKNNHFHSYRRNKTTERNYNIYFPHGEKK